MAFWKKSEDPWDWEPKKQPIPRETGSEPGDGASGLLDELRDDFQDWNENRKAAKARRETPPEPIPCPWCGQPMEPGYLIGGRDAWYGSAPAPCASWTLRKPCTSGGTAPSCATTRSPGPAVRAGNWCWTCRSRRRPPGTRRPGQTRKIRERKKTDRWHNSISNTEPWAPARPPTP
jgi:hypothetical protein